MLNIPSTQAEVDLNRSASSTNRDANQKELANGNVDESAVSNCGASTSIASAAEIKPWDILKEKISFLKLLQSDGHKFTGNGKWIKCRCPFHDDSTPSFVVSQEDTHGRCFGCNWYGNIFDYEIEFHGVDFREALKRLSGKSARLSHNTARLRAKKKDTTTTTLSMEQKVSAQKYGHRLVTDEWLRDWIIEKRFGGKRGWKAETLRHLALEGSLGWAGDSLAFIYPSGMKFRRWPAKDIVAECNGISLWREHRLPKAKTVYLTEGETDAISLVDSGIETDQTVAVIALWSATGFQKNWAQMFSDKKVVLCLDNDAPGEHAMEQIGTILDRAGADVRVFDWKEVA